MSFVAYVPHFTASPAEFFATDATVVLTHSQTERPLAVVAAAHVLVGHPFFRETIQNNPHSLVASGLALSNHLLVRAL